MGAIFGAGRGRLLLALFTISVVAGGCMVPMDTPAPFHGSLKVDGSSSYVWRGREVNDDWVVQPSLELIDQQWTLKAWGNVDATDSRAQAEELTEYRLSAQYQWLMPQTPWQLAIGYMYYDYPSFPDHSRTQEVFLKLTLPQYMLVPTLTVFRDIDANEWTYATLKMHTSLMPPMLQQITGGLFAEIELGYGDRNFMTLNFDPDLGAGLTDVTATVRLPLSGVPSSGGGMPGGMGGRMGGRRMPGYSFEPFVSYRRIVDDELAEALEAAGEEEELWYGGLRWAYTW